MGLSNWYLSKSQDTISNTGNGTLRTDSTSQNTNQREQKTTTADNKSNSLTDSDDNTILMNGDIKEADNGSVISNDTNTTYVNELPQINTNGPSTTINIGFNNNDLPGFYPKSSDYKQPPSDLSQYKKVSDLQPDSLVLQDKNYISFEKSKKVIEKEIKFALFSLSSRVNESRFTFDLGRNYKAILLQFALEDLTSGNTSSEVYTVKIFAGNELLWAGQCQRSQGRQIVSVPLDIVNARTITIEATSNNSNNSRLYFLEAKLFQ